MKPNIGVVVLTIGLVATSWGQPSPSECMKIVRIRGSFPKGPFKTLPGESYKRSPTVKFLVQEDGTVSDASITHSSGVADIDKKILDAVAKWKYKPRHSGCAVIENEMTATIHWGESHSTISTRMGSPANI
jgi:TonB family protein